MKRYCQTLKLKNDPELIRNYVEVHNHVWPEIKQGFRDIGILDMEIYMHEGLLFMIVETVDGFDWEKDYGRLGDMPRQREWEAYVAQFQECTEDAAPTEKWKLMQRIFAL